MSAYASARNKAEQISELPESERGRALAVLCEQDSDLAARVEALIRDAKAAEDSDFLAYPILSADLLDLEDDASEVSGPTGFPEIPGYEVLGRIGSGGSGTVYRARGSAPLDREVAIKVLRTDLGDAGRRRFRQEQQLLARISHAGVAQVYDSGTTGDGRQFVVVEFVNGPPITSFVQDHGIGVNGQLRLMASVCDALHHIHGNGILHQDLKPENILVHVENDIARPKIIDFGASIPLEAQPRDLTTASYFVGTLGYMAPERLNSANGGDVRSDVFAAGVILYEMLAGEHPFGGKFAPIGDIIRDVQAKRIPKLPPSVRHHRSLNAVIACACAKRPDDRYASTKHMADDLERALAGRPVVAASPSVAHHMMAAARRRPLVATALAGGLALMATFAGRLYMAERESALRAIDMERTVEQLTVDVLGTVKELSGAQEAQARLISVLIDRLDAVPPNRRDDQYYLQRSRVIEAKTSLMMEQGDPSGASSLRQLMLAEFEQHFAGRDWTHEVKLDHVLQIIRLGDALISAEEIAHGNTAYWRAHQLMLGHGQADPESDRWRDELVWSYERLTPYLLKFEPDRAMTFCEMRLQLAEQMHAEAPDRASRWFLLGCAQSWYGEVLMHAGRLEEALAMNELAVATLAHSRDAEPDRFAYSARWLIGQGRLTRTLGMLGSPRFAVEHTLWVHAARGFAAQNPGSGTAHRLYRGPIRIGCAVGSDLLPEGDSRSYCEELAGAGETPPPRGSRIDWLTTQVDWSE